MSVRLASLLGACLLASSVTAAVAAPKAKKKGGPVAPAKDTATPPGSPIPIPVPDPSKEPGAGTTPAADGATQGAAGGANAGAAVQPIEDAPPGDMNGTDENPDAPHAVSSETVQVAPIAPPKKVAGYPIEEALRPITLPQNMSEVSIDPHAQVSPYIGNATLRARYGITRQVQLGLAYTLGGIYHAPTIPEGKLAFHPGKTVGLDLTFLIQDWIGVRVGVPVYLDPIAVGLTVGAPIKFTFGDKFALGGFDDLLTFTIHKFPPSFYQEYFNELGKVRDDSNTGQPDGALRFSVYGDYQYTPELAIIGRFGVLVDNFSSTSGDFGYGGLTTFIRAGFQYSPKHYLDLGLSIGFDDLAHGGSFSPAGYLAFRI